MSLQAPIGCDTVWGFSGFWWPCQFWGVLVRYMIDYPTTGIYLLFFSWSDWGYGFWRGRPQKCHFHHVTPTCLTTGYWPCSPDSGSVCQVSPLQSCSISPFLTVLFEGSHYMQLTFQGEGSPIPPPWRQSICVICLKFFCMGDLALLSFPFSNFSFYL